MTHPYLVDQARALLTRAGGDPDKAEPLAAAWGRGG